MTDRASDKTPPAGHEASSHSTARSSVWDRPERPVRASAALSRDQIVRAAIDLIDAEGPDALSMRKLAARMGVGAMSLYWHVERKADLMELVADAIFGELDLPDQPSGDWPTDLRRVAVATRTVFLRHPWLLSSIGVNTIYFGPNFLRHAEFSFASLSRTGLDLPAMITLVGALDSYVFGSVLQRVVSGNINHDDPDHFAAMDQAFGQALTRANYPTLERLRAAFAALGTSADLDERTFDLGLEALLDGIALHLDRLGASHGPAATCPAAIREPHPKERDDAGSR